MNQTELIHHTDWDVLIILDACRWDYLVKIMPSAEKVISPGGTTGIWLKATFPDFYPLIYISAMPWISKSDVADYIGLDHFNDVIEVWRFGWDDELKVTLPQAIVKAYLERAHMGRMVVHFGQPHLPYIGDPPLNYGADKEGHVRLLHDLYSGKVDVGQLREAYFGNVKLAWKYAKMVIDSSKGKKLVVTADHGERLMEPYATPPYIGHGRELCPQLVEVPWVVIERDR